MRLATVVAVLCSAAACSSADEPLAWLAGCWTDGSVVERWTLAEGGYLFGSSVTVDEGGAVSFFEQLRIEPTDTGLAYYAYPAGSGPTRFDSVEQGEQAITFANPTHDYPQRISYRREGGQLRVTISLHDGGNAGEWVHASCR